MYIISKKFDGLCAAHALEHLPSTHKCSQIHGHNYSVEVFLLSKHLNHDGFVTDFGNLDFLGDYLKNTFDHKNLNNSFNFYTTSENLSKEIYELVKSYLEKHYPGVTLIMVRVKETDKTSASYFEADNLLYSLSVM